MVVSKCPCLTFSTVMSCLDAKISLVPSTVPHSTFTLIGPQNTHPNRQSHIVTKPQSQKDTCTYAQTTDIWATFSKQLKNNCTHGWNQSCAPIQLWYVGLDVFDPQQICAQRTRRGLAHRKDWAIILFACMSTHVVHIEVVESKDTSSFINVQLYSADS